MIGPRDDPWSDLPRTVGEAREINIDGKPWLVFERVNQYDRRLGHVLVFQVWEVLPETIERRMRDDPLLRPRVERRRVPEFRPRVSNPAMARGGARLRNAW